MIRTFVLTTALVLTAAAVTAAQVPKQPPPVASPLGQISWAMFDFAVAGRNEGGQPGTNDKGLVTHDRSLIELVADRLWLAADGRVKPFAGDMEDYARFVLERAKAGTRAPSQGLDRGIIPAQRPARRKQKGFA